MRLRFVLFALAGPLFFACAALGLAADGSEQILAKAAKLFGEPLNAEHRVYRLSDNYVLWLVIDSQGDLFEVVVGPKSFYSSEFPNAPSSTQADHLSEREYREILGKISQLKNVGALLTEHGRPMPTDFGPVDADRFEGAFVDRVLTGDSTGEIKKFNVYFLQNIGGSPEQLKTVGRQPMVCLGGLWYYSNQKPEAKIKLGEWHVISVAGPNLQGTSGCSRTAILHDADGFTIEEPQNETIVIADPYQVRTLEGRVTVADQPVEGANVEVRVAKHILRCKTDANGNFKIPKVAEGRYKFKVTKDGFKALTGSVIVEHNAPSKEIEFELYVGT